jgi:hypothetical protein
MYLFIYFLSALFLCIPLSKTWLESRHFGFFIASAGSSKNDIMTFRDKIKLFINVQL